jgi:hypothetical protein
MCKTWIDAHKKYDWTVDLTKFNGSVEYPGHFNRVVTPADVVAFEDKFRAMIEGTGSFEVAGEVCFWKNYGSFQSRNRITQRLLLHLETPRNWAIFMRTLKRLSGAPSFNNFIAFRDACNQPRGFATPITFLAFYDPVEYSMVDKHIAYWWAKNKTEYGFEASPIFSQRSDGWIQTYTSSQDRQNWKAYITWTRFCRDYAELTSRKCRLNWRARDVEMAVWEAQKMGIHLNILQ